MYGFDKYWISVFSDNIKLRGNFINDRFRLTSMVTSLKNCLKCLAQNLILCLSSLHRENPVGITMYIT